MAFYRATPMILYALFLCMRFASVVPQTPTASPLTGPVLPPVTAEAPVPVAAQVPTPAGVSQPEPQVTNMIEALRDAGQFGAIAGLLDGLQMRSLTPMTTWLVPNDDAFSGSNYPTNVTKFLDYHVIRELLPFSRLLTLSIGTRIPTFLGTETCLVTNDNQLNFSINNAMIVVPDLYSDSTVAVHGIDAILDDAAFVGVALSPDDAPVPSSIPSEMAPSTSSPSGLPTQSAPEFNITFADAAHRGLSAKVGFRMAMTSVLILVATAFLSSLLNPP